LERLVRQLDAQGFADQEKATAELDQFGPNAVQGVKARQERTTSLEVRQRPGRFLSRYDSPEPSPYHLGSVRGAAVLEGIGTAHARALLAELAKGQPYDILTNEARAAGRRLRR
jgi:hypothetical protein